MKEIYILSGLGADERVFRQINFSGYKANFIQWILPLDDESIENYASRLLSQINSGKPTLIGLSFGGMMAMEIAKQIETEQVVLISSAKTRREIPFYFKWIGFLRLHKIIPAPILKKSNSITNWIFGVTTEREKELLKIILSETNPIFLKWAIDKIVNWRNTLIHENIVHIHGSADKILPIEFVTCNFKIDSGGHLMVLDKAEEISVIIRSLHLVR